MIYITTHSAVCCASFEVWEGKGSVHFRIVPVTVLGGGSEEFGPVSLLLLSSIPSAQISFKTPRFLVPFACFSTKRPHTPQAKFQLVETIRQNR